MYGVNVSRSSFCLFYDISKQRTPETDTRYNFRVFIFWWSPSPIRFTIHCRILSNDNPNGINERYGCRWLFGYVKNFEPAPISRFIYIRKTFQCYHHPGLTHSSAHFIASLRVVLSMVIFVIIYKLTSVSSIQYYYAFLYGIRKGFHFFPRKKPVRDWITLGTISACASASRRSFSFKFNRKFNNYPLNGRAFLQLISEWPGYYCSLFFVSLNYR